MSIEIPLLKLESEFISKQMSGVTTITFYKGNLEDVVTTIRNRFKDILLANPWLAGKLVQRKGQKRLHLSYPEHLVDDNLIDALFQVNPSTLSIHSTMKYMQLGRALKPAIVQKPKEIINQDLLVTKLTLCNDSVDKTSGFSLIFSLSHSVGDGHTYYKILNMLSEGAEIYALNVKRKEEETSKIIEVLGKREYGYIGGFSHVVNVLKGLLLRKNANAHAYYIDPEKIEISKLEAKKTKCK